MSDHSDPRMAGRTPADPSDAFVLSWLKQSTNYAAVMLDPQGTIIAWLGASEHVLGYSAEEVIGQPVSLIFTDEDRALGLPSLERSVAQAGSSSQDDRWHVRKDGTRVWFAGTIEAICGPSGEVLAYLKVMRDRTDLRATIETLEHRVEALTGAARCRSEFFARLVHELRNALAPISNATELIRRAAQPSRLEFPLAMVRRQLELLGRMVGDLFQITRAGANQLQLQVQRFDLAGELRLLAATVLPAFEEKRQQLRLCLPPAAVDIEADGARLQQLVVNLLDNANKYTPAGGTIWLKCTVEGRSAVIRVQDTGIGVPPELLPRIFDLFTREAADPATEGLGVGLSVVKELVDAHGGSVEVRSGGSGHGSEFTVRLPLHADAAARQTARST
ncbi:PAS domain-containing sensor histidine kinase [Aquabacterium sp. A7-Y]|uniref:sensor histidine kinase n=1 Tax=Aquabacterium sp. A7-Y TaxID=1349605 RepID=UPI00223DE010|nr:PAS domain-containing sensor histidine kinase [Aquabacterium sp. A7-Y]MCW7541411.1 PAS domain-containing sensor histidine kinase [Aquabacterium sp. A7-Y]